ncbi:hypothetical protein [Fundidesulfovibrio putealis]|uniref:hypothetical protein n=1 Tax=Fundidesulfovibrio putealis TaxID=270496 RepID=UPI0004163FD6|nr:hypothetical protein [Fundidesulfovibrio putealis]
MIRPEWPRAERVDAPVCALRLNADCSGLPDSGDAPAGRFPAADRAARQTATAHKEIRL